MNSGLSKNVTVAASVPEFSKSSQPVSLGAYDLNNLSDFARSASNLGLLQDQNKLSQFLSTPAAASALAANKLTPAATENVLSSALKAGIPLENSSAITNVSALLGSSRALDLNMANMNNRLETIVDNIQKYGLMPERSADNQTGQNAEVLSSVGPSVTGHKLRFVPFDFSQFQAIKLWHTINDHAVLYIKGVLAPQSDDAKQADDKIIQDTNTTAAALYSVDEQGNVEIVFKGIIRNIKQTQTADVKTIEVEIVSPSYLMDITKMSRSYQQMTATYDDILAIVAQQGVQAQIINCEPTKQTGKLIVQFLETPWNFAKRLASHFNTGLVALRTSDDIQIYFGVPKGQESKEISVAAYSVNKDLGDYRRTTANDVVHSSPNLNDSDFVCYQVQSFDRLSIGDPVTFLNYSLFVRDVSAVLERGALKYTYTLVSPNGLKQKDIFNERLIGVSLMATVKTITNDQIKAHIYEIDQEWDEQTDWYFPYSTVYSTPSGSGWYMMPEPGDTVKIHFGNHREEDAVASSSVDRDESLNRQNEASSGGGTADEPRSDPDKKSISNVHGKEILLTPDGIYITNQAGQIYINLTDADGITIMSSLDINLQAAQNVIISAGQNLSLIAGEKLTLNCGPSAAIQADKGGNIDIFGTEVKTN